MVEREWLRRLNGPDDLQPASESSLVSEVAEGLGGGPLRWGVDLGRRMALEITREIPTFGGDEEAFETLRMGTESATLVAMLVLASDDSAQARLTMEGLEGDRDFVRRGIRLDLVLRGIGIGHALMSREILEAVSALVEDPSRAIEMERVSATLFRFNDVYSSAMAEEYLAENDRWVTSAAAERAEVVRTLLEGDDVSVVEASKVLGYDLQRQHLAWVLYQAPGINRSPTDLQRASRTLLRDHGCTASLEIPQGASSLWVWGSWRHRGVTPGSTTTHWPARVHVAAGSVAAGPEGFRQSHLEAAHVVALTRSRAADRTAVVTRYADVELAVLLYQDTDRARAFVIRELGPAAAATAAAAELRETVATYLACDRSLKRAAELVHVARNTVAYRVKKFEEQTGRDLRHRRLELEAALRLAAVAGHQVLMTEVGAVQ